MTMWRGLDRSFTRALEREGVPVQDTAGIYTKVLFRRKRDNADGGDWLDAYTRQEDGFKAGDLLAVGGDNYLLVQRDHRAREKTREYAQSNEVYAVLFKRAQLLFEF